MPDPATVFTEQLVKEAATAAARGLIRIASETGRQFVTYFVSLNQARSEDADAVRLKYPPMVVVGLGRCGSFVTGQLLAMLRQTSPSHPSPSPSNTQPTLSKMSDNQLVSTLGDISRSVYGFFVRSEESPGTIMNVEPRMLMGDIDETIFGDVVRWINKYDPNMGRKILQISYEPLAYGGVGNTPIFSEFLTRGLLLLPPANLNGRDNPWASARNLLLDGYSVHGQKLRLAFYIFAASGGTGSGAANEFLRAQRFTLAVSGVPHQVYFCGIGVLPRRDLLQKNQTHQRNAGRLLTQYLADLNLDLPTEAAFSSAPEFRFDAHLQVDGQSSVKAMPPAAQAEATNAGRAVAPPVQPSATIPLAPWDALLLVSNDVMPVNESGEGEGGYEEADRDANMYIAQCMFNISSAQLPVAQINDQAQSSDQAHLEHRNFQSRRLDPNDLRTGLNGPACLAFSALSLADARSGDRWIDRLFAMSIWLPARRAAEKNASRAEAYIQGISICPEQNKDNYNQKASALISSLSAKGQDSFGAAISELSKIRLFARCPRAVFIFTSPQTGEIPSNIETRMDQLLNLLCPNLVQLRSAIVRGTTASYTLTIIFETSVVNVYDLMFSFSNYIWLAFAKSEHKEAGDFQKMLMELINRDDKRPLAESDLEPLLEEREDWSRTVINYRNQAQQWERNWRLFKEGQRGVKADVVSRDADTHSMEHLMVTRKQVLSALNYIRYSRHFAKRAPIQVDD